MGYNLQDHYGTGTLTFTIDQPVSLVQTRYENIPAVLKYAIFGSGPLTVLGGVEVRVKEGLELQQTVQSISGGGDG